MVCWPHNHNMHETQTGVCQDWQAVSLCPSAYKVYATQLRFQLPLTNYNMSLFHWRYALRSVLLRKVTVAEGPYTSLVARHVDIGIENCLAATGATVETVGWSVIIGQPSPFVSGRAILSTRIPSNSRTFQPSIPLVG